MALESIRKPVAVHPDRVTTHRLMVVALLLPMGVVHLVTVAAVRRAATAIDHLETMAQRSLPHLLRTAEVAAVVTIRALDLDPALVPMMTNRGPTTGLPTVGPLCRGRRLM